jgi:hypothetical protein
VNSNGVNVMTGGYKQQVLLPHFLRPGTAGRGERSPAAL